jgi:hypothetical protein
MPFLYRVSVKPTIDTAHKHSYLSMYQNAMVNDRKHWYKPTKK